jgi:hypothetical protein
MKYRVSLGMVINMGNYNTIRAEISTEADTYIEAFEESRTKLFDAAYHLAKEVRSGLGEREQYRTDADNAIDFLASKLTEEPRI